ncbi:hypothetical protein [Shimia sp.]|uniref:COG3904 family protein n=1 Tax=Shimia sp. TaxID=1954381 RepID=UPI0035668A5A
MFKRVLGFPLAHWRGRVGLGVTLLFTLLGLRLAIAWAGGIAALWLDAALYLWQVVGSWRALRRHQRDTPDFLVTVAAVAAILTTLPVFVLPQLDRISRDNLAPMVLPEPGPSGVTVAPDHILLAGPVGFEMFEGFKAALAARPELGTVVLASDGGRVYAARAIARLIRDNAMDTRVADTCASACTLLFIAGSRRSLGPGGRLGFHGYSNRGRLGFADAGEEEARDRATFLARGVDAAFVARMFRQPHDQMWFPERAVLQAAGILTEP